jgi:protein-histidine pros-kinase
LNDILGCAEHLLQLINDLLDLSKIEAEKMELTLEPFSAQHIIREVCSAMTPAATKQAVRIRTEFSPDVEFVRLDPLRFKQIIYNLVSNAVKFSKRGKEVLVRLEPAFQRHFRITVVDSGIGIRSDDLGRLFGKFEQLQSGLARGHEGSGLGLALTKKLVELHNGSIEVQSEFGWGSTFTVVLPVDASK